MKKSVKQFIGVFILTLGLITGVLFIASQVNSVSLNEDVAVEQSVKIEMTETIAAHP